MSIAPDTLSLAAKIGVGITTTLLWMGVIGLALLLIAVLASWIGHIIHARWEADDAEDRGYSFGRYDP